jgi:hypothetical protein
MPEPEGSLDSDDEGVIHPKELLVRPLPAQFQILAGISRTRHERVFAAEKIPRRLADALAAVSAAARHGYAKESVSGL